MYHESNSIHRFYPHVSMLGFQVLQIKGDIAEKSNTSAFYLQYPNLCICIYSERIRCLDIIRISPDQILFV